MAKSKIFHGNAYKNIEAVIIKLINGQADFLSAKSATSPRAAGDAIQGILSDIFRGLLGDFCAEYSEVFARRAMADLAFQDKDNLYYVVDVKTHRLETHFNMPNLTSVERLARLYEDDRNYFVILMVSYSMEGQRVQAKAAHFVPIEFLSWECLTIGALGWGQIQIANANVISVKEGYPRKNWMLELCDVMLEFYPKEIEKIGERIEYFRNVRKRWEGRKEDL
jgi:hypothetical protein